MNCVVRSMLGELPLHGQQALLIHTGRIPGQAPSLGAWVSYGLAVKTGIYLVMYCSIMTGCPMVVWRILAARSCLHHMQATVLRPTGSPIDNIEPSDPRGLQRRKLALLAEQDREFAIQSADSRAIEGAIANYETAFRMQSAQSRKSPTFHTSLSTSRNSTVLIPKDTHQQLYAMQALRARRLIESGSGSLKSPAPVSMETTHPGINMASSRKIMRKMLVSRNNRWQHSLSISSSEDYSMKPLSYGREKWVVHRILPK